MGTTPDQNDPPLARPQELSEILAAVDTCWAAEIPESEIRAALERALEEVKGY